MLGLMSLNEKALLAFFGLGFACFAFCARGRTGSTVSCWGATGNKDTEYAQCHYDQSQFLHDEPPPFRSFRTLGFVRLLRVLCLNLIVQRHADHYKATDEVAQGLQKKFAVDRSFLGQKPTLGPVSRVPRSSRTVRPNRATSKQTQTNSVDWPALTG